MRVLHVSEPFGAGTFQLVRSLSEGTVRAGHEVAIAHGVSPETPADHRALFDPRIELHQLPWFPRTAAAQARATRALRALARAWRPDVVHLHSSFAGVVGSLALGSGPAPTVWTPHAFAGAMRSTGRAARATFAAGERLAARRVTVVGAVSCAVARLAREYARAPRVEIVENGIPELDPGVLIERERPAEPRVVGMGRAVPQRRPEACARILRGVADVADVVWIGGGGGDAGSAGHEALAGAGVRFTGWLGRDQVLRELGDATAYLHWTAWDGLPLSVLEAMAQDVVVIASDIEPNAELLAPEQVCATEEQAIARLRRVVLEPPFGERLRAGQRERRRHYSAQRMVADWLALYERLLKPG